MASDLLHPHNRWVLVGSGSPHIHTGGSCVSLSFLRCSDLSIASAYEVSLLLGFLSPHCCFLSVALRLQFSTKCLSLALAKAAAVMRLHLLLPKMFVRCLCADMMGCLLLLKMLDCSSAARFSAMKRLLSHPKLAIALTVFQLSQLASRIPSGVRAMRCHPQSSIASWSRSCLCESLRRGSLRCFRPDFCSPGLCPTVISAANCSEKAEATCDNSSMSIWHCEVQALLWAPSSLLLPALPPSALVAIVAPATMAC